jgi:hypothetical protein
MRQPLVLIVEPDFSDWCSVWMCLTVQMPFCWLGSAVGLLWITPTEALLYSRVPHSVVDGSFVLGFTAT